MNHVSIIGRATDKPSLKYVGPTNRPLAEFALAYDDPFNKDTAGKKRAYFFLIMIWGTKAELAAAHISKGQKIGISGRLIQETFTPNGTDRQVTKTRIVAENFDLLERPASSSHTPSTPPPQDPTQPEEDQIPF
jgi:single-strand DNA-binding protein